MGVTLPSGGGAHAHTGAATSGSAPAAAPHGDAPGRLVLEVVLGARMWCLRGASRVGHCSLMSRQVSCVPSATRYVQGSL